MVGLGALRLQAQLPVSKLDSLFPPGGQAGSAVTVQAAGADLDDPTLLSFSHPGITATLPSGSADPRFQVLIASNVPPGLYEARFQGRFGRSNPRIFSVGDLPEFQTSASNRAPANPLVIPASATVNGRVAAGKSDYIRFESRAGQRVIIECQATDIDSRLEPVVWLRSPSGREIGRSRLQAVMDVTVPADGAYELRVHDHLNRGGDDYFYRLTVSSRPSIDFALPSAVQPGAPRAVTFYGRNLPGGQPSTEKGFHGVPLEQLQVMIEVPGDPAGAFPPVAGSHVPPSGFGVDGFLHRISSPRGTSLPIFLGVTPFPTQIEEDPRPGSTAVQKLTLPVDLTGRFASIRDIDRYEFEATKGQVWQIEVLSQRMGFHTDAAFSLHRVKPGKDGADSLSDVAEGYDTDPVASVADFRTASGDPSLRFEVKEDGRYRILLRDQSSPTSEQSARVYRLVIRPPTPDFRLVVTPSAPPPVAKDSKEIRLGVPVLREGGVIPLRVTVLRQDGFDAPVRVTVEGLPPGVTSSGAVLAGDVRSALMFIAADAGASNTVADVRVTGVATTPQGERRRQAAVGSMIWAVGNTDNESVQSRMGDSLPVGPCATEPAPWRAEPVGLKAVEAVAGGKVQIPFTIRSRVEFAANLKLRLAGHPLLGAGKEIEVDKKATNAVFELDLAQLKWPEGEFLLHVETPATFPSPRSASALSQAEAEKQEIDKQAPALKESADKARASLADLEKSLAALVKEAATVPDRQPAADQARVARDAAEKASQELGRRIEDAGRRKAVAEERIKRFARKDFSETLYSVPVLLKVAPARKPDTAKP